MAKNSYQYEKRKRELDKKKKKEEKLKKKLMRHSEGGDVPEEEATEDQDLSASAEGQNTEQASD